MKTKKGFLAGFWGSKRRARPIWNWSPRGDWDKARKGGQRRKPDFFMCPVIRACQTEIFVSSLLLSVKQKLHREKAPFCLSQCFSRGAQIVKDTQREKTESSGGEINGLFIAFSPRPPSLRHFSTNDFFSAPEKKIKTQTIDNAMVFLCDRNLGAIWKEKEREPKFNLLPDRNVISLIARWMRWLLPVRKKRGKFLTWRFGDTW